MVVDGFIIKYNSKTMAVYIKLIKNNIKSSGYGKYYAKVVWQKGFKPY
jgi:hypothetical protein